MIEFHSPDESQFINRHAQAAVALPLAARLNFVSRDFDAREPSHAKRSSFSNGIIRFRGTSAVQGPSERFICVTANEDRDGSVASKRDKGTSGENRVP